MKRTRKSSGRPYPGPAFPPRGPFTILDEAKKIVFGRGESLYGHPRDNFLCLGEMWNAYLIKRGLMAPDSEGIQPRDVAMMKVLIKVAREAHSDSRDNLVDIAGYAATAERLDESQD
jgi:uncharacterized protein DUF6378